MQLIKDHWSKKDIPEFQQYIKTLENKEKQQWSKKLLNTSLPVLCITTKDMKYIIEEISKGNYLEFLDLMIWEYYENTAINGFLITKIKDFNTMKKYLDIYSSLCDNWATCDLLIFNVKGNEENFYNLALNYLKNDKPFVRRIGLSILFNFINDHIDEILLLFDTFENEQHYYVNMMLGWLLSECFIKQRGKTLKYYENKKLNKFALNKSIQKCRESRRVSIEDKDMLCQYKKK